MSETLSTPTQVRALLDATDVVLRDCILSRHANTSVNEARYAFSIYDQEVNDVIKSQMQMAALTDTTPVPSWTLDIARTRGERPTDTDEQDLFDFMYRLDARTGYPGDAAKPHQLWLPLSTQLESGPALYQYLDLQSPPPSGELLHRVDGLPIREASAAVVASLHAIVGTLCLKKQLSRAPQ